MIRLPKVKIQEVREQLLNGVSWRDISKKAKISSHAIARIARTIPHTEEEEPPEPSEGITYPDMDGPYVWCEECNTYVKQPCLACQIRALKKRKMA